MQRVGLLLLNNICLVGDEAIVTDIAVHPNVLKSCQMLLKTSMRKNILSKTVLFLANLMTNPTCIQFLMDSKLMPLIFETARVQPETFPIIANMFTHGDVQQRKELIQLNTVAYFVPALNSNIENEIVFSAVNALDLLFTFSKENGLWPQVEQIFEETEGLENLEQLQTHPSEEIYTAAVRAIDHFQVEDDE